MAVLQMGDRSEGTTEDDTAWEPTSRRRTAEWQRLVALVDGYAAEEAVEAAATVTGFKSTK